MISRIFKLFKKQEASEVAKVDVYKNLFKMAQTFTKKKKFNLDYQEQNTCEDVVRDLVNKISKILAKDISNYPQHGFDPIVRFGGDCGNIHYAILNFIKQHYPNICANITVGEASISNQLIFKFNQNKCIDWLENGSPQVLDCHTWITINNDYILDCTIGTYINTRIDSNHEQNKEDSLYGGIIFGIVDKLEHVTIKSLEQKTPQNYRNVEYFPIILGLEAFIALAPKQL